jgi:ferritin-like metal-binding protein YciE
MVGLVGHVYQAIDKQVKGTEDEPDVNPVLRRFRDSLERQHLALEQRLDALGGQGTSPIKEAGASILGVAAGVIDKLRSEEVSKNFRDNYTALALTHISYLMLNTTCLASGDEETAALAGNGLRETAQFISDIGGLMPQLVVRDLKDEANLNKQAVQQARREYKEAWSNV